MKRIASRRRLAALLGAVALGLSACQAVTPPPATPRASEPTAAVDSLAQDPNAWTEIRPEAVAEHAASSSAATCVECHADVNSTMTGVVSGPAGLVAVGWIFQGFHGMAWHSAEGRNWLADDPLPEQSSLEAVAADASRYVAVGLRGHGGTVWTSSDGISWRETESSAFAAPLQLTSVVHWPGGFVAAGYTGSTTGDADAAFWTSPDGLSWRRAPDTGALHGVRPASIAATASGLVAVGTAAGSEAGAGSARSVVLTSRDGVRWSRVPPDPAFDGARMESVAAVPGIGLVAAGEDDAGNAGVVWVSRDGGSWARVPATPDFGGPDSQVRIHTVVASGRGAVAVGFVANGADAQYGQCAVWTSPDGLRWQRQPSGAEFVAGDLNAIAPSGSGFVAVGYSEAPDDDAATVWTSPPGWNH